MLWSDEFWQVTCLYVHLSLQELCATQHLPVKYLGFHYGAFIGRRISSAKRTSQSVCYVMLLCIEQHDQVGGIKNKTVCVETHREKISFKNAHLIHHRKIRGSLICNVEPPNFGSGTFSKHDNLNISISWVQFYIILRLFDFWRASVGLFWYRCFCP